MNQFAGVRTQRDGNVFRLVLNRPKSANALDIPTALALREALDEAENDHYTAVLLSAEGPRFCAGGDVAAFSAGSYDERAAYLHDLATLVEAEFRRMMALPKPVVAAVHGAVAGAGLGLLLSTDIVVAAKDTKFVWGYSGVGLTPDCGVSYLLPRAIGTNRALQFALEGGVLTAEKALEWGLVARVAGEDEVQEVAANLAHALADGPVGAHAHAKRLLRQAFDAVPEQQALDEARTISERVVTPEATALVERFLSR